RHRHAVVARQQGGHALAPQRLVVHDQRAQGPQRAPPAPRSLANEFAATTAPSPPLRTSDLASGRSTASALVFLPHHPRSGGGGPGGRGPPPHGISPVESLLGNAGNEEGGPRIGSRPRRFYDPRSCSSALLVRAAGLHEALAGGVPRHGDGRGRIVLPAHRRAP